MKLTKENKELIWISKFGNFRYNKTGTKYVYGGKCKNCGEHFLAEKYRLTIFCSKRCAVSGKNNYWYGKTGKQSSMHGRKHSKETRSKIGMSNKGKKISQAQRDRLSECRSGSRLSQETKDKISKQLVGKYAGEKCFQYKGGIMKLGIPLYDTYAHRLQVFEEVRIYMLRIGCTVFKTLQVRCNETGCKKWFRPTNRQVQRRLQIFNGELHGQSNFYCSDECKHRCTTFNQKLYFKDQNSGIDIREIRRKENTPLLTRAEKSKVKAYKTIAKYMGDGWHLDHILPVSCGGGDHPDNLQIIPAIHNLKKGAREGYVVPEHLIFRL